MVAILVYLYLTSDKDAIKTEEELGLGRRRINAYRGVSTPVLVGGNLRQYLGPYIE